MFCSQVNTFLSTFTKKEEVVIYTLQKTLLLKLLANYFIIIVFVQ